MKPLAALGAAATAPIVVVIALLGFAVVAAGGPGVTAASRQAVADIPTALLPAYRNAAAACPLPWPVLAAIGKVETDHGRSTLPGVHSGANSFGAEGPMQFLPATWAAYGTDANGDGRADVYDPTDAIWGAARLLCANGAGNPATLRAAIFSYNHADWYVQEVLQIAASYATAGSSTTAGPHATPLDGQLLAAHPEWLTRPHHDHPAIDIPVPVGTDAYAVAAGTIALAGTDVGSCGGTVILNGDDGATYTYCHASAVLVATGARVDRDQLLLHTGGAAGAPGAGNSSGPHLHFGVTAGGVERCPQPVLQAWTAGQLYDPINAPTSGCTT